MENQIDLLRCELFNQAPQMDAVSQKANMSMCKEARTLPPARHRVREGHLRSEVEDSLLTAHPDQITGTIRMAMGVFSRYSRSNVSWE